MRIEHDISIVLCGQAGQGIQTVELLLTRILKLAGFNVFATKEYMSRIRGGMNSTEIRVSSEPVRAYVDRIDILIALDKEAIGHVRNRISDETLILADGPTGSQIDDSSLNVAEIGFTKIAASIGNKIYSNIVAVGVLTGLIGIDRVMAKDFIRSHFSSKEKSVVESNIKALDSGFEVACELSKSQESEIHLLRDERVADQLLLSGSEAVGLGALAGGCNFISSYPMSPSTSVLLFLAKNSEEFGIVVEQAEDEIAAINMAIGAWYAGARAMVTTSGGGFALMTEGISLAGMLEVPVVIHLAQRPGPATGLPTRTEQGDLELALYAGHGEFPRIIFAPGNTAQAFHAAHKAFYLADKYQIPVIILTDQYLMDSYYNTDSPDMSKVEDKRFIVKSTCDYNRYQLTADGISPRAIPGFGRGLVCVDSDEHDEAGHITEDLEVRVEMVNKRLGKRTQIADEAIAPELIGPDDYKNLVVCWGSTYNCIEEVLRVLGREDTAFLHYAQVFPLHRNATELFQKAARKIIIEGNATCQFGKILKLETGIEFDERILKYNGIAFSVEEIVTKLKNLLV